MPQVKVALTAFRLDRGRYSRALDESLQRQMRMAARAFLKVAVSAIPVRTGFARGSLGNLADAINAGSKGPNIDFETPAGKFLKLMKVLRTTTFKDTSAAKRSDLYNLSRGSLRQAGSTTLVEYYRDGKRRVLKTPQSGREFSTQPNQVFQSDGLVYKFDFSSWISYLNINEDSANPRTPSAPWNAFKYGRVAFLNYLKAVALERLPKVQAFLVETSIQVTGTTKTETVVVNSDTQFDF